MYQKKMHKGSYREFFNFKCRNENNTFQSTTFRDTFTGVHCTPRLLPSDLMTGTTHWKANLATIVSHRLFLRVTNTPIKMIMTVIVYPKSVEGDDSSDGAEGQ